jgi:hypothetical protein
MIFQIYSLCTGPADAHRRVKAFYNHVLARGYKPTAICPLFQKAYNKLRDKANQTVTVKTDLTNTILFHLQYHPNDLPSSALQQAWRENVFSPPHCKPLPNITNKAGMKIGLNRPLNLGTLHSYRRLTIPNGPPVSSYRIRQQAGPVREIKRRDPVSTR